MSTNISRRSIAKGAAWATPAVLATSVVPAYAASTEPTEPTPEQIELRKRGVRGAFTARVTCGTDRNGNWANGRKLEVIGNAGTYPNGGYHVEGVNPDTKVTSAIVTLYIENPWGENLTWTPTSQNRGWIMVPSGSRVPARAGYTPYDIIYNGTNWAYDAADKRYYINDKPFFETSISSMSCPNNGRGLSLYAVRTATIDGVVYNTAAAGPIPLAPER